MQINQTIEIKIESIHEYWELLDKKTEEQRNIRIGNQKTKPGLTNEFEEWGFRSIAVINDTGITDAQESKRFIRRFGVLYLL